MAIPVAEAPTTTSLHVDIRIPVVEGLTTSSPHVEMKFFVVEVLTASSVYVNMVQILSNLTTNMARPWPSMSCKITGVVRGWLETTTV